MARFRLPGVVLAAALGLGLAGCVETAQPVLGPEQGAEDIAGRYLSDADEPGTLLVMSGTDPATGHAAWRVDILEPGTGAVEDVAWVTLDRWIDGRAVVQYRFEGHDAYGYAVLDRQGADSAVLLDLDGDTVATRHGDLLRRHGVTVQRPSGAFAVTLDGRPEAIRAALRALAPAVEDDDPLVLTRAPGEP